jgi:hypothetical protein
MQISLLSRELRALFAHADRHALEAVHLAGQAVAAAAAAQRHRGGGPAAAAQIATPAPFPTRDRDELSLAPLSLATATATTPTVAPVAVAGGRFVSRLCECPICFDKLRPQAAAAVLLN